MSKKQIVRKYEREQLQKQSRLQRKKDKVGAAESKKTKRDNLEPKERTRLKTLLQQQPLAMKLRQAE